MDCILSFLPGIQIFLLMVVFILSAVLGITTTRKIYGLVLSGATFVKLKDVDEPFKGVWNVKRLKG